MGGQYCLLMPGPGYRDEGAKETQVTHTLEGHCGYDCILLCSMVPILFHLSGSDLGIKAKLPVRQPSTRGLPEDLGSPQT